MLVLPKPRMTRLVEQRKRNLGEIDRLDRELRVLFGLRHEPIRDGQPRTPWTRTDDDDLQSKHQSFAAVVDSAVACRTAGATTVPSSSIAWSTRSCGIGPTVSCARKRSLPNSSCSSSILSMTSCGLPTSSDPRGERSASNCARVVGGQPRSRPMRDITSAYEG